MSEIIPAYSGEAVLLRWGENHKGRTVTLQLDPDLGDLHPFKGLRGGDNGQRFMVVCVLVDENEDAVSAGNAGRQAGKLGAVVKPQETVKPQEAEQIKERKRFSQMPKSQQAALKCRDPEFQRWLRATNPKAYSLVAEEWSEQEACDWALKLSLVICSKSELDEMPSKGADWDMLLTSFDYRRHA